MRELYQQFLNLRWSRFWSWSEFSNLADLSQTSHARRTRVSDMKRILLIVGLQLLAFWEVWQMVRLTSRVFVGPTLGIAGVCRCVRFSCLLRESLCLASERSLLLPALLIVLYVATYFVFPPLARAIIAFTALAVTASSLRFGKLFHPGLFGLFYLSLPALPTLQFFGGYPLRVVVAELTAPILRIGGFAVVPEGTCLNWAGQLIWIDAPCSGIKMLWVGMFLTFVLLCLYELPVLKSMLLVLSLLS